MAAIDVEPARMQGRWSLALRGGIAILIGIIILTRPLQSVGALALVLAIWALVEGVAAILFGIGLRSSARHWWVVVFSGLVSMLIGIIDLVYAPGLTLRLIIVVTAWWLLITGVLGIFQAVQDRKGGAAWGWTLGWGVLGLLVGVAMFFYPGLSLLALMRLLAWFAIFSGILRLGVALQGRPRSTGTHNAARHPLRM